MSDQPDNSAKKLWQEQHRLDRLDRHNAEIEDRRRVLRDLIRRGLIHHETLPNGEGMIEARALDHPEVIAWFAGPTRH
jgi:hypothetical protein